MTTDNDREYFRNHPQYHMYLHPEMPGYEDQIGARDRFVAAHPQLRFVGAHLGSLEYDVDRIAAFLDRFPNASVDMAARMSQVQYQSVRDLEKVRNFFVSYQDRLLYGTDLTFNPGDDAAANSSVPRTMCGRATGAISPRTRASASRSSRPTCAAWRCRAR